MNNNNSDTKPNREKRNLVDKVQALDNQVLELSTLLKAGRAMSNILDPHMLYNVLIGIVREKIKAGSIALFVYDDQSGSFQLAHSHGIETTGLVFSCEQGMLWQNILQGEPFRVVDNAKRPLFEDFFRQHDLNQLKSEVWVPMIMLGKAIALMTLGVQEGEEPLDEKDLKFLHQIANQASVSINTARLYARSSQEKEELDRTVRNLSLLYNIGRAMTFILELKELLRYILKQAIDITKTEKGSIMLYDAETGELHIRVIEGIEDKEFLEKVNNYEIKTQSFKPGEGVAGKVFQRGKPMFLNDIGEDKRFIKAGKSYVRNIGCVPMTVFGDIIGVINVTNKKTEGGFTDEDEELLKAVADQAAVAVNKAQLWEMAVTDSLTGLYIRRFFLAKVGEELRRAERYSHPFAIIMADIDHFKSVNDNYGHPAGDRVLVKVANKLKEKVRQVDIVARFGGEEFVLLLPETDREAALMLSNRLREAVESIELDDMPGVTISLGVSGYPDDGSEIEGLIQKADAALYKAKQTGRNKSVLYTREIPLQPKISDLAGIKL